MLALVVAKYCLFTSYASCQSYKSIPAQSDLYLYGNSTPIALVTPAGPRPLSSPLLAAMVFWSPNTLPVSPETDRGDQYTLEVVCPQPYTVLSLNNSETPVYEILSYRIKMVRHKYINRRNGFRKGNSQHLVWSKQVKINDTSPASNAKYLRLPRNEMEEICNEDLKMYDSDRNEILNVHILRPSPARKTALESAQEATCEDELDRYKLWHCGKVQEMFSQAHRQHTASAPQCTGTLQIDKGASTRRGFGWKERLRCNICRFVSPSYELYKTIPSNKPGPKKVDLNYTCHTGLMHTGISGYGLSLTLASMNAAGPHPSALQKTANVVGEAIVKENSKDMQCIRQSLKRNNTRKGLRPDAGINMAVDARYNNRMESSTGNSPFQAATQATQLFVEHETPGRKIISLVTRNKLCQTARRLEAKLRRRQSSEEITCPNHPGYCSANVGQDAVIGKTVYEKHVVTCFSNKSF